MPAVQSGLALIGREGIDSSRAMCVAYVARCEDGTVMTRLSLLVIVVEVLLSPWVLAAWVEAQGRYTREFARAANAPGAAARRGSSW